MLNVDSIGSLQLNNQDYKTLYVSDEDNYFTGKIIENIGHTTSMFPRDIYWYCNGVACDSDFINGLRCYLQNDTLVYKKDEIPCDTTYEIYTSINENKVQQIVIAPNPFNASISIYTINSSEFSADELHYNLYNITGALLKGGIIPQNGKLNLSDLKQGIYAIQLLLSNKTIHTQKIIKQ